MKALKITMFMLVLVALICLMAASADAAGKTPYYRCARHAQVYVGGKPLYFMGKPVVTARACPTRRSNGTTLLIGHDAKFVGTKYTDGTIRVTLLNGSVVTGWAYQWVKAN